MLKTSVVTMMVISGLMVACNPDDSVTIDSNGQVLDPISGSSADNFAASTPTGSTSSTENTSPTDNTPPVVAAPPPSTFERWSSDFYRCGERSITWHDVNDWHYQLQDADYEELANSRYDLLVIDSEPPVGRPNRNVIDRVKCAGDGEKLLVSYLAVGQAEEYRYYYQDDWGVGNPDWIVYADLYWPGDYYVRYWEPEWRQILMGTAESRVDRIIEAGFDGIYLDTIDGYTFFEDTNPNAIDEMQALVADIANYARAKSNNPDFGVFVQNAEELIAVVGPEWVAPLTGIGKEEPFFWAMDERVADEQRYWNNLYLGMWVDAGKVVLNVDYVTTEENRQSAIADSRAAGYVPLMISDKALDRMDYFPDHQPD